jgi:hypothetical protein
VNHQDYCAAECPEVFEHARPSSFGRTSAPFTTGPGTDRHFSGGGAGDGSDEGVSMAGAVKDLRARGIFDAGEFARAIRQLAVDAHRALKRPDASAGDLMDLRRRCQKLLRAARGSRQTEIHGWLRSVDRTLDSRLASDLQVKPRRP